MKIDSNEFKSIVEDLHISFEKYCELTLIANPQTEQISYYPQLRYANKNNYDLLEGVANDTAFCKFKPNLLPIAGLYLWVVDGEIVYIGEGRNLQKRFNNGYGNISPRNCYKGGQSTNVKMNRAALSYYEQHKHIEIYICENANHKAMESALLEKITTIHNVKLNTIKNNK